MARAYRTGRAVLGPLFGQRGTAHSRADGTSPDDAVTRLSSHRVQSMQHLFHVSFSMQQALLFSTGPYPPHPCLMRCQTSQLSAACFRAKPRALNHSLPKVHSTRPPSNVPCQRASNDHRATLLIPAQPHSRCPGPPARPAPPLERGTTVRHIHPSANLAAHPSLSNPSGTLPSAH